MDVEGMIDRVASREARKKRVVIDVDNNDLQSIKKGERQKAKLENQGYTLVDEKATPFRSRLVYELRTAAGDPEKAYLKKVSEVTEHLKQAAMSLLDAEEIALTAGDDDLQRLLQNVERKLVDFQRKWGKVAETPLEPGD